MAWDEEQGVNYIEPNLDKSNVRLNLMMLELVYESHLTEIFPMFQQC